MAAYTQYSSGSNSQVTLSQRLLHNGSDYLSVRISEDQTLILQGDLDLDGSVITFSDAQQWIYTGSGYSRQPELSYSASESGTVTITNAAYVYGSFPEFQHLQVMEVINGESFATVAMFIFIVVSCVFRSFSGIRNKLTRS